MLSFIMQSMTKILPDLVRVTVKLLYIGLLYKIRFNRELLSSLASSVSRGSDYES